jgi:hypothetical protein
MANDAFVLMREMDVDALLYDVEMPFTFPVKTKKESEPLSINTNVLYRELDTGGDFFSFEGGKLEKINSRNIFLLLQRPLMVFLGR